MGAMLLSWVSRVPGPSHTMGSAGVLSRAHRGMPVLVREIDLDSDLSGSLMPVAEHELDTPEHRKTSLDEAAGAGGFTSLTTNYAASERPPVPVSMKRTSGPCPGGTPRAHMPLFARRTTMALPAMKQAAMSGRVIPSPSPLTRVRRRWPTTPSRVHP